MARLVIECIPPGAVASRYGGDEFLVVLPGCDADAGLLEAEAIARHVAATPLALRGASVPLTVSVGLATAPRGGVAGAIASLAFDAAADARRRGGNRACRSEEPGRTA